VRDLLNEAFHWEEMDGRSGWSRDTIQTAALCELTYQAGKIAESLEGIQQMIGEIQDDGLKTLKLFECQAPCKEYEAER